MARYAQSIGIKAPPAVVWEVWRDIAAWPQWAPTFQAAEPLDDAPFAPGKQVRLTVLGAGTSLFTITTFEEGRAFAWENDYRGVHAIANHEIEPAPDGCVVTLSVEISGLMSLLFRPMIARVTKRNLPIEAEGLKRFCESKSSL